MSEEIKELSDKIDRMRQEFIRDKYQSRLHIFGVYSGDDQPYRS